MDRRQFVAALSLAGVSPLAGCLGDDTDGPGASDGSEDGTDGAESGDGTNSQGDDSLADPEQYSFPPADEPAAVPEELFCAVCNMTPADYPEANAQLVHEDASRQFFCSPGCFVSYWALPEVFDAPEPIENGWAREFETRELVDAADLHWVLNTLPERGMDPMRNPVPFADRGEAEAYADSFDDLSDDDIIETPAIDRGVAEQYREFYFDR